MSHFFLKFRVSSSGARQTQREVSSFLHFPSHRLSGCPFQKKIYPLPLAGKAHFLSAPARLAPCARRSPAVRRTCRPPSLAFWVLDISVAVLTIYTLFSLSRPRALSGVAVHPGSRARGHFFFSSRAIIFARRNETKQKTRERGTRSTRGF